MKKTYLKDGLTVLWDSDKCIHARKCRQQLPEVFDSTRRPWIDLSKADVEAIKRVIDCCPTGALSYEVAGEQKTGEVTITIIKDGPAKVTGKVRLVKENGEVIEADDVFALCRCGASQKAPFCDGSHYRIQFLDQD